MRSERGMPPQWSMPAFFKPAHNRPDFAEAPLPRIIWNPISSQADGLSTNVSKSVTKVAPENGADKSSACKVALIGFGTVGRAVAKILCESGNQSLRLTHICNRNIARKKQDWVPAGVVWTEDVDSVLDSDVAIVIELIGGINPAEQIVRRALESGKSVVTANKQLIARHGPDLLQLAASNGVQLEFGASVAGGVPVLPALRAGLSGDRLHGIAGILNGTCNYILSRIESARIPFSEALEEAQARGYATGPMIGFEPEKVKKLFGISDRYVPVMLVTLGHAAPGNSPRKPRLSVEESLVGIVVRRKKPLQVPNVQISSRYQSVEVARSEGLMALLSVPRLAMCT